MRLLTSEGTIELTSDGLLSGGRTPESELLRRAVAYHKAGRVREAEIAYQSVLQVQPCHSHALHLSGVLAHQVRKNEAAIELIERAIECNPGEPDFYINCGEAYRALHNYDLALDRYQRALAIGPPSAGAHYNLGLTLQELGRQEEAIEHYEHSLVIDPDFAEGHNNLGVALQEAGRQEESRAHFEQALTINPYFAEAHNNLGIVLKALGRPVEAITHHQTAMRLAPGELTYHITFTECLNNLQITQAGRALQEDMLKVFQLEGVNHQEMAFAASSLIKRSHDFREFAALVEREGGGNLFRQLSNASLEKILSEPLLLALLRSTIIRDRFIERVLTETRKSLLHTAIEAGVSDLLKPELIAFVYALAHQCFSNEYVYVVSDREAGEVKKIEALITSSPGSLDDDMKLLLGILACYIPLYEFEKYKMFLHLIEKGADSKVVELITLQIIEPAEEKRLRSEIKTVGSVDDEISQKVRTQYEENPYPRWLGVHKMRGESIRRVVKRLFPHIGSQQIGDNPSPDILVAGCGTGQQVITKALDFPSAKVLGVDISLSSLSYGKRRARELKIPNADFIHADLLNLSLLDKAFDLIECIGVLHHLGDPMEGWRVLASLLKPGGLMRIGLYSETARKDVVRAQAFVTEKGYAATPDGIRQCRQDIFSMPDTSALSNITKITDFYTLSETRDLLFHVQENRFTLPHIAEMIRKLGLTFIGFEFNNPIERKKYLEHFRDDPTATCLNNWHKYEQENTNAFISLYLFWVQKSA